MKTPKNKGEQEAQQQRASPQLSKYEANLKLDQFQLTIGITLFASAALGIYLLATDKSLWLLAVSHAYGLIAICAIDVTIGCASILKIRKLLLPSMGWAVLTILLQLGDIATAPQYNLAPAQFAKYLFGLWAFDGLLAAQVAVIVGAVLARSYLRMVAKKKKLTYFDMGLKNSRRDFLQIGGTIGVLFAIAAGLGIWTAIAPPESGAPVNTATTGPTSNLPSGAVANVKDLQLGVPVYFDYPSRGATNMLRKNQDGTVSAMSILCTHICCACQYDSGTGDLFCPCHGSVFDANGKVLRGPAATSLPTIQLSIDSQGNIFPIKVVGSGPCVSG